MSKLFLVRHGETKLNSRERFWGQTDVELGATGIRQAEQLGARLATEKISAIYASELRRASVTAEIIASSHRLEVMTCAELNEINFGEFEGRTFEEIGRLYPEVAKELANWGMVPRFPAGEGIDELDGRVSQFLPRLEKHTPEATVLIVAHAGTLRLLMCKLLGLGLLHWRQFRLDFASLSIVETYPRGAILSRLNDVSHLNTNPSP